MVGVASSPRLAGRSALQGGGRGHGTGGGGARKPRGTFVHWAALPGGVAPPRAKVPGTQAGGASALRLRLGPEFRTAGASKRPAGQDRALICRASAKSAPVRPPAECVDNVKVTLFHWISTSGWWLACSAR